MNFDSAFHVKNGLADGQLEWLTQILSTSKADGKKVIILGHQPI